MQAECYKSTISHELRTPLESSAAILMMILQQFKAERKTSLRTLKGVMSQLTIILSQIRLMESFVEDLLNLRLLKDGILTLDYKAFNLKEAL